MGRKRTQLQLSAAQEARIRKLVRATSDLRDQERLRFALKAATGKHTLEELARLVGRSRSTLQNWLAKFLAGGLEGLLERDTPPGKFSPIAHPKIHSQLKVGMKLGRWASAAQVAAWLKNHHGINRSRKTVYYWLGKFRTRVG